MCVTIVPLMPQEPYSTSFLSIRRLSLTMAPRRWKWALAAGGATVAVLLVLLTAPYWFPQTNCSLPQKHSEIVASENGMPLKKGWFNGTVFPFPFTDGSLYGSCSGGAAILPPYLSGTVTFDGCSPCSGSIATFNASGWTNETNGGAWSPFWCVQNNLGSSPCTSFQYQSISASIGPGESSTLYVYVWSNVTATLQTQLMFYWGMCGSVPASGTCH